MTGKAGLAHSENTLSRRERQIMDVLFALKRASAAEIMASLPERRNYSTIRTILGILERKGQVRHEVEGLRYVYEPVIGPVAARRSAMNRLVKTFFDGSMKAAAAAFLDPDTAELSDEDLKDLEAIIRRARRENRS